MTAYYNDNDPFAAAWLRELITAGLIAPGEVDERSIEEIKPADLRGFTQCHFFGGVGGWSYALRLAGWPDAKPVWTGSCPCPPFSSVGIKKACPQCQGTNPVPHVGRTGFFVCGLCDHEWLADARHLWPELWRLISLGRPDTFFGEQVASDDGRTWLTSVRASLEILGYAVGAADLCSAGVGASDIRQRLFFVAHTEREQLRAGGSRNLKRSTSSLEREIRQQRVWDDVGERGSIGVMGEPNSTGSQSRDEARTPNGYRHPAIAAGSAGRMVHAAVNRVGPLDGQSGQSARSQVETGGSSLSGELGQSESNGRIGRENNGDEGGRECPPRQTGAIEHVAHADSIESGDRGLQRSRRLLQPSENPLTGFWRDAEWIYCQDEKWRPVEPGSFPLAHGIPARVGRVRGYGNAINAEVAKAFIEAYMSLER